MTDTIETVATQPSDAARARSVAKEGGWAGILSLLGAAIRYGNTTILARLLGAKAYGLYAVANSAITVVTIPAILGLPTSMVHFIATDVEREEWGRLRWVIRVSFRLILFASLAAAAVVIAAGPWAARVIFNKDGLVLPLCGLALSLPFLALYAVSAGALQGLKAIRAKVFIERIAHPLIFSVLLLAGGYFLRSMEYVVACFFLAAGLVSAAGAWMLRRRLAPVPRPEAAVTPQWRELFAFSTPVLFMQLLQYFILFSDVLVMGMFRSAAEVGVYAAASRLATAINMPTDSLSASLAPSFSGLVGKGDREGLRRLFHTSTRWIYLLAGGVALLLVLGGLPILHVFGKDFTQGYVVLCILAVGQMASASFGANGTLITMTGHPKVNLVNSLCLGMGNLGLNLLLVPRYGALGAATAAAASVTTVNLARALEIWLILKIGPWDRTILKPMLTLLLGGVAGGGVYYAFGPVAGTIVGAAVFALVWWLLRPEPEDLDLVRRTLARLRRSPTNAGMRG